MTTRTLSLSDDAYRRLKKLKQAHESFSDVVLRLTDRPGLMQYAGSITKEFAEELEHHSTQFRERFDRDANPRTD